MVDSGFWDWFDCRVFAMYHDAEIEASLARCLIERETEPALLAALASGLVEAEAGTSSLLDLQARIDFALAAGGHNDSLVRFAALQLTLAHCERILEHWAEYYWFFRGDDRALDFDDPATMQDFEQRFFALLADDEYQRAEWQASGLQFDDLFEY